MEKKDFTKEQLHTLISEGVKKILNENSNMDELFNTIDRRWVLHELALELKKWMNEKFSNYKFEIKKMRLPPNVAGFTTKEGVFFNQDFLMNGSNDLFKFIFAIIHEFEHYKEYLTISDELEYIKTEEDFETFFQNVIAVEKRVDNATELEMHEINLMLKNPNRSRNYKQPFDLLDYIEKYKPFMKQVHDLWLKHREKYHSIDDLLKAISFGEIKLF